MAVNYRHNEPLPICSIIASLFFGLGLLASGSAPAQSSVDKPPFTPEYAHAQQQAGWQQTEAIRQRIQPPTFPARDFNILDYGASDDSTRDARPALIEAIRDCHDAGRMLVPVGTLPEQWSGPPEE